MTTPAERYAAYKKRTAGAAATTERGDALADYAAEMLSTLKGVKLDRKKVISSDRSQEIDVVMWNERFSGKNALRFLSHTIFVEAKNWDYPVGAAESRGSRKRYGSTATTPEEEPRASSSR